LSFGPRSIVSESHLIDNLGENFHSISQLRAFWITLFRPLDTIASNDFALGLHLFRFFYER